MPAGQAGEVVPCALAKRMQQQLAGKQAAPRRAWHKSTRGRLHEASRVAIRPSAADAAKEPLTAVFVAAEVAPYSKTGGLADVLAALPPALAAQGHRVMVVSPRYLSPETEARYKSAADTGVTKGIDLGPQGGYHDVKYFHVHKDHVDWVFVDHISYHRSGTPYGNASGPYTDNLFRFSLLCMAAIEATLVLNVGGLRHEGKPGGPYGQRCLFVANDWHAALLPVYLAGRFRPFGVHKDSKCVLAVHNLSHQGSFPPSNFGKLGLPGEWYSTLEWVEHVRPGGNGVPPSKETRASINCLKAGLVASDIIVTVSQSYAAEICGLDDAQGHGLSSLLNQRAPVLRGIVNGVDAKEWNPMTNPHLKYHYSAANLKGKVLCKMDLQHELGLPVDPDRPLLGFIGRLDYQKGPDLLLKALVHLINSDCQVVILGSGAADYEEQVKQAQIDYPYFVRGIIKFDVPLSHRIMAGSDLLLMPSRFEPCGLNQMHAQLYGTVPVVHSTGGLRDTVDDYNAFAAPGAPDRGTGWTFYPATLEAFVAAVRAAVNVFRDDKDEWARMQVRCMKQDFSWSSAAQQYERVFKDLMTTRPAVAGSK